MLQGNFVKYLTVLRRSKMFLVLQFELILKIGSIICAYGGGQKNISRAALDSYSGDDRLESRPERCLC
jgi:hypothetical protein